MIYVKSFNLVIPNLSVYKNRFLASIFERDMVREYEI